MTGREFDLDGFVTSIGQAIETVVQMERSRSMVYSRPFPPTQAELDEERAMQRLHDEAEEVSQKALRDKTLLRYICPALKRATSDAFDIARILATALVPLSLAGTLTLPLNPWLFALMALIISRMGVDSLCGPYWKESKQ